VGMRNEMGWLAGIFVGGLGVNNWSGVYTLMAHDFMKR
jgi:hypothetical protein